jgi:preprotein translocase subunit SecE
MIAPIQYIKESQAEIKKVTWPTREKAFQYTSIVAIISIVSMIVLGGLDIFFNFILKTFIL